MKFEMRKLFSAAAVVLAIAAAARGQQPRSIHKDYNDLIISNWDHKSPKIKRYDPPASLVELERSMNNLFATGDDPTRPWRGFVTLMLVRPDLHPAEGAYQLPEWWRLNFMPQEGGKFQYHVEIDTKLVQQIRLTRGDGGAYTLLVDDTQPGHLALASALAGGYERSSFGSKRINVFGGNRIVLGAPLDADTAGISSLSTIVTIHTSQPLGPSVEFGNPFVVTRAGQKYLKVKQDGVKYGLRLERFDW